MEKNCLSNDIIIKREGKETPFLGKLLFLLYGFVYRVLERRFILDWIANIILKLEGGECQSITLRKIFNRYFKVNVGLYSLGACFIPENLQKYTTIGRYCSIAYSVKVFNRDHPTGYKSTHPYFFNPALGYCEKDLVEYIPLNIGHDVWMGHNVIIMPNVREIGTGAVIAGGAVVNKDVPPYAIFVGNPGRVVRYRFSPKVIEKLLASKWWEKSIEEIKATEMGEYIRPYEQGNQNSEVKEG